MKFDATSLRYERKFILEDSSINSLLFLKYCLPFDFEEIFHERVINSIYYDTQNLFLAKQGIEGDSERSKIRVRYYGDSNSIEMPILEVKIKKGYVGDKYKIPIEREKLLNSNFRLSEFLKETLVSYEFNDIVSFLKPIAFVSYKRNYYTAFSNGFRFTFDRDISFKMINSYDPYSCIIDNPSINYFKKIIELKYAKDYQDEANKLVSKFPFRLSSFSKYKIALSELGIN